MDRLGQLVVGVVSGTFALLRRACRLVAQAACGLRGHETLIHFKQRRMTLRCQRCGHETPGWTITTPSQTPAEVEEERRRAVVAKHRIA